MTTKALTTFPQKLLSKLDLLVSPNPNYANQGHKAAMRLNFKRALRGQARLFSLLRATFLCLILVFSKLLFPICYLLHRLGFRFVDIDLNQIGSTLYLDFLLREDTLNKRTPKFKLFVVASNFHDGNRYILDLYSHRVVFIRGVVLKLFLAPIFASELFSNDTSHAYEQVHGSRDKIMLVWNQYNEIIGSPIIKMPSKDLKMAENVLKEYVDCSKPFVALHVRDTGFYGIQNQDTRNADISSYQSAIDLLVTRGFIVIRIGDNAMKPAKKFEATFNGRFFDYAHSPIKSEMMDCYLISQCRFMIGCASGPSNVAPVFNKNCVNVNWYNATTSAFFTPGDLTAFKKFVSIKTGALIPFKTILCEPFKFNPTRKQLASVEATVIDNTEDEIYETVLEFLEKRDLSSAQSVLKGQLTEDCYSFGALGNISDVIAQQYVNKASL